MATITKNWTTVATKTVTLGVDKVKFYLEAKYANQNNTSSPQTTGFQTRLREERLTNQTPWGKGYLFTCTYCTKVSGSGKWTFSDKVIMASSQKTITHDSDGKKSLSLSARVKNDGWDFDETLSGTATLPSIEVWGSVQSVPDIINDEDSFDITFSKKEGLTAVPYVAIKIDSGIYYNLETYNTSSIVDLGNNVYKYTWSFITEQQDFIYAHCNKSDTYPAKIGIIYKQDNVEKGRSESDEKTFKIIDCEPTATFSNQELNSRVASKVTTAYIVNNASKMKFNITPTLYKGAKISKIEIKPANKNGEAQTLTFDSTETIPDPPHEITFEITNYYMQNTNLSIIEPNDFALVVTDSRNKEYSQTITKGMIKYFDLRIESLNVERNSPTGSDVTLNAQVVYASGPSFGGIPQSINYYWQLQGEGDTWHELTNPSIEIVSQFANRAKFTNIQLSNAVPYNQDGTIIFRVVDAFLDTQRGFDVVAGISTMDAGESDLNINGELYVSDIVPYNNQGDVYKTNLTPFRFGTQQEPSTYSFPSNIYTGGYLTSSRSGIYATVYLPRPMQENVTPTITGGQFTLRSMGGYLEGSDTSPIDVENLPSNIQVVVSTYGDNQIGLLIHKGSDLEHNTAYTAQRTLENNTPVGLAIKNLEITFVETSQNSS